VAAHWKLKSGKPPPKMTTSASPGCDSFIEWSQELSGAREFSPRLKWISPRSKSMHLRPKGRVLEFRAAPPPLILLTWSTPKWGTNASAQK